MRVKDIILYPHLLFLYSSRSLFVTARFSEYNDKDHRFGNVSFAQIDVGGSVKGSSKDQSRPVSLELGKLDLENFQQSQENMDRVVLGTESGYSKLLRHSRGKSSLFTENGLINGSLVTALIGSGCGIECVLIIQ
jgi:hypothetical protein